MSRPVFHWLTPGMVSLNVREGHLPSRLLCLGSYLQLNLLLLCFPRVSVDAQAI